MSLIKNLLDIKRVSKFSIIGGLATFIHVLVFYSLIYQEIANEYISNLLAYLIALVFSYIGHSLYTFSEHYKKGNTSQFLKFITTSFITFLINTFWVWLFMDYLGYSLIFTTGSLLVLTPLITFILFSTWVFK